MAEKMVWEKKPPTPEEIGNQQLQEVYRHLDHCNNGNIYISWYGQCRAKEMTHKEALDDTIAHFRLFANDWYKNRFDNRKG